MISTARRWTNSRSPDTASLSDTFDDTRASEYAPQSSDIRSGRRHAVGVAFPALWAADFIAETLGRARSLLTDPFLGLDEDMVVELIPAVTSNHSKRMSALGLVA